MENKVTESEILDVLENNPIISQRKISEKTGISLGMVNILIKKCIKMGFLKVENLNSRTVKYILTPQGINEKTKKTLKYIKHSYKMILDISFRIEKYAKCHNNKGKRICLLGDNDEVMEIVERVLKENEIVYIKKNNVANIDKGLIDVIYLWEIELEEKIILMNLEFINIVKKNDN